MKILVVGDTEAVTYGSALEHLRPSYDVQIEVNFRPGCKLTEVLSLVKESLRPDHEVILLHGLSSTAWELAPLICGMDRPKIVVPSASFDVETIPTLMTEIVTFCHSVRPDSYVTLMLPCVKDIYRYNIHRLQKADCPQYETILASHPLYNRERSAENSLAVYNKINVLKKPDYQWENKLWFSGNYGLHRAYNTLDRNSEVPSHVLFMKGSSLTINCELLHDGFHMSPRFILYLFRACTPGCEWLRRCSGVPSRPSSAVSAIDNTILDNDDHEVADAGSGVLLVDVSTNTEVRPSLNFRALRQFIPTAEAATQTDIDYGHSAAEGAVALNVTLMDARTKRMDYYLRRMIQLEVPSDADDRTKKDVIDIAKSILNTL